MVHFIRLAAVATFSASLVASKSTGFSGCDALLDAGLGDSLLFPAGPDSAYDRAIAGFWTAVSQEATPWCILQPKDAAEVSKAVKALSSVADDGSGHWHVGIKGGGHSHWNSNNVGEGVSIDLARLSQTTVTNASCISDRFTHVAHIGAGSRWTDAVKVVEQYGLAVTGGRVGTVGVGGLTVGGGASFYSGYRGFSCDDVINYEVVLADGSLVNANKKENPRLFKALKGGSNNFGIVTRFDMAAFPAGPVYGGIIKSAWEHRESYIQSFLDMLHGSNRADSQILMYQHETGWEEPTVGTLAVNVDGHSNSSIFTAIKDVPTVSKFAGQFTYGQLIGSGAADSGKRNVWYSICFHAVREMIDKSEELMMGFISELNSLSYADSDMDTMFSFQPMPKSWAQVNPGGNVLGVDESLTEDSILFLAQTAVTSRHAETFFQTRLAAITAEIEAYAESIGANTPFRYLNYVHPSQNPLKSYGAKNVAFMKEVAAEYDPSGFFQTRVSGGFKISAVE